MTFGIKPGYAVFLLLLLVAGYGPKAEATPRPQRQELSRRAAPVLRVQVNAGVAELSIKDSPAFASRILVQRKTGKSPFMRLALLSSPKGAAVKISDPLESFPGIVIYRARFISETGAVSEWSSQVRIRLTSKDPSPPTPPRNSLTSCSESFLSSAYDLVALSRAQLSLSPLSRDTALENAAEQHSRAMAITSRLSHDGWYTAVLESGFKGSSVAQNIASGYSSFEDALNAWLKSPSHRGNLISPKWNVHGLGCAVDGTGRVWLTHNLGYK